MIYKSSPQNSNTGKTSWNRRSLCMVSSKRLRKASCPSCLAAWAASASTCALACCWAHSGYCLVELEHFGDRYSSTNNQAIFWSKTTGPGDQLDEWNNLSSTSTYLKSGHFTFEYGPHLSCTKPNSLRWNRLPTSPPNLVTHLAHALPRLLKTLKGDVDSSNGQALGESWWLSFKENRWKHSFNGGSLLRFNLNTCWKVVTCLHLFLNCLKSNNNLNGSQEPTGVWNSQLGGPLIRSVCFMFSSLVKNPTRPATIEKYLGRKPENC